MRDKGLTTVGLDIGSHSVKCVEWLRENGQPKLNQLAKIPVNASSNEALAGTLKQFFSKTSFATKKLRISVSGPSLLIRRVQLPRLTHAELKGAIRFEAESHIPFPIDDCFLDFQILDEMPDKKLMNVLLVAAKKELVQERLGCVADLGMEVELIDVDAFCVLNAFEALGGGAPDRVYGLLNIGRSASSFVILQDKTPFYVRETAWGSHEITRALAEAKAIPEDEAEKIKVENAEPQSADILTALRKGLEPFVEELRHAIDYFENESGESLKWIGLSGGGAMLPPLAAVLTEELGKQAAVWDIAKNISPSPDVDKALLSAHGAEFGVAIGLALRELR